MSWHKNKFYFVSLRHWAVTYLCITAANSVSRLEKKITTQEFMEFLDFSKHPFASRSEMSEAD